MLRRLRIQHVKLARLLAMRGEFDLARFYAAAVVAACEYTDVPVPIGAEMKALLKANAKPPKTTTQKS